jgi:hypothetical protein
MDADQAAVMGIDSVMNVWVEAVHPERLPAAGLQVGSAWAAALIPRPCAMHAATSQLIAGWPGVFAQRSSRPSPFTRLCVAHLLQVFVALSMMDQCLDGGDGLEVLQADEDGQTITVSQEVLLTRQSPAAAFLPFCDERDCYLTMYSHSTDNYL